MHIYYIGNHIYVCGQKTEDLRPVHGTKLQDLTIGIFFFEWTSTGLLIKLAS